MEDLKPGDLGFTRITGFVGWWINLGQALTGDSCRYTHVFVILDNGRVVEAMPSGARFALQSRQYRGEVVYARLNLTAEQRSLITCEAERMMRAPGGIKYSFIDYLALALLHWGFKPKYLRNYVITSKRMICSQLADYLLGHAGYKVFDDGRLHQDVTPGDLYYGTDPRHIKIIGIE